MTGSAGRPGRGSGGQAGAADETTGAVADDGVEFVGDHPILQSYPQKPTCRRQGFAMNERRFEERTQWVYDDKAFPVWNASFDRTARTDMIRDDLWAGRSIAMLLAALVTIGVILALITVLFVSNWR